MFYEWAKALHIISFVAWMAGMLYLPRLYVYHCGVEAGSEASETFKVMERRLLRAIMTPAMISTWIFGLYMMMVGNWYQDGWFHFKLLLVVLMSMMHGFLARWHKDFEQDRNTRSQKFYRVANEVPTVLLILIVFLVVLKPF